MASRRNKVYGRFYLIVSAAAIVLALCHTPVFAVVNRTANINVANIGRTVAPSAIALHTSVYDNQHGNANLDNRLVEAGVQMLRYPGGSYADIYHWRLHSASGGYAAPQSHFGNFVDHLLDDTGAEAMITVNYGRSIFGNFGGQPEEAAAWVAYANGDPSDTTPIGVDADGLDWGTVGQWALIRTRTQAQNPDPNTDFLAIDHDEPLGIKHWEIGNEINGNGYYGSPGWENDLHYPYGGSRFHQAPLSPASYATNLIEFSQKMKEVDPTIQIGAVLVGPGGIGDDPNTSFNWDRNVLMTAGDAMVTVDVSQQYPAIDFGIYHYYINNDTPSPADGDCPLSRLSGCEVNALNGITPLANNMQTLRNRIDTYTDRDPNTFPIHITEFGLFDTILLPPDNGSGLGTVQNPVTGLFTAATYATALEEGATTAHWHEMSKPTFLGDTSGLTRGPAFYGMQMVDKLLDSGDEFVASTTSNSDLKAYAVVQDDGTLAILLLNTLSGGSNDANVTLDIDGDLYDTSGSQWLYGVDQTTPLMSSVSVGNDFSITVPDRSLVLLLIPAAVDPLLIGDYNGDGKVSAADFTTWQDNIGALTLLNRDPNNSGPVDGDDFESWKANYGEGTFGSGAGFAAVPEPSSLLLAGLGLVALLARRRLGESVA